MISPKDEGHNHQPPSCITFACFDKRVVDGAVLAFDDSVRPRVVHGNVNVLYAVPVHKPVECRDVGCAVVYTSGKHHLSFRTFSHLITDIRQDKTEPTYYMSYHIKHRILFEKILHEMSKNKTEKAVIKSLILLHLRKKLLRCEKVQKLK